MKRYIITRYTYKGPGRKRKGFTETVLPRTGSVSKRRKHKNKRGGTEKIGPRGVHTGYHTGLQTTPDEKTKKKAVGHEGTGGRHGKYTKLRVGRKTSAAPAHHKSSGFRGERASFPGQRQTNKRRTSPLPPAHKHQVSRRGARVGGGTHNTGPGKVQKVTYAQRLWYLPVYCHRRAPRLQTNYYFQGETVQSSKRRELHGQSGQTTSA